MKRQLPILLGALAVLGIVGGGIYLLAGGDGARPPGSPERSAPTPRLPSGSGPEDLVGGADLEADEDAGPARTTVEEDAPAEAGALLRGRVLFPSSLAVVPALLLRVAEERFAVPLGFVAETARLAPEGDGARVTFRGRILPLVAPGRREGGALRPAVVLEVGGRQGVLLVDTLLGQEDVVVRPVHAPRGVPRWVNGATILSDGLPALVLDPTALV